MSKEKGLDHLLNYAHLVDDGVIINKDGALLMSYRFRGSDINSATGDDLDGLTAAFNRMVTQYFADGWLLHIDEMRLPSMAYPEGGYFPSEVAQLIDDQRRAIYQAEGAHFENQQIITFVWKFPLPLANNIKYLFIANTNKQAQINLSQLVTQFKEQIERALSLIKDYWQLAPLTSADLLSYLNTCITGELLPVAVPSDGSFIDVVLSRRPLVGGYYPKIGDKHIRVLTLHRYLNQATQPGLLEHLATYPISYRFSNRFLPMSRGVAAGQLNKYRKDWHNKTRGFFGIIREIVMGSPTSKINYDAVNMHQQTLEAMTENEGETTRFGYWSSSVVLMHEDQQVLANAIKEIRSYVEKSGFVTIDETINCVEAWLGTIPGHGRANIRRILINSRSLAHLLPLSSIWSGNAFSSPKSLLPANSPPVYIAATTGNTPFKYQADVEDNGHTLILGPSGRGKSTYLQFYVASFLRYEGARIYIFDKDNSHFGFTHALGGKYYDIGKEAYNFAPLAKLNTDKRILNAITFVENLVEFHTKLNPDMRSAIAQAVKSLSQPQQEGHRTITVLRNLIQDQAVRAALDYYTLQGTLPLLDAATDDVSDAYLQSFEMGWLLGQKPENYVPVLDYLFNEIEQRLREQQGKYPTLVILEEAWLYIKHPVFANKIIDWLKSLRKYNGRVIFATQSLTDLYDHKTGGLNEVTAVIENECDTKIFLANNKIGGNLRKFYVNMDLNDRQIAIIQNEAVSKRHYYIKSAEGNRLIDLGLDHASKFIGLSQQRGQALVECQARYGADWLKEWQCNG